MSRTALVIGGSGPTGPHIVAGLEARGFGVTILHTGAHEVPEIAHLPHLHGDVRSLEGLREALGGREFDIVVATYGRLRAIAEVLVGRVGQLISVGGVPAYRGYFDAGAWDPPGLPVPTRESAPTADETADGKSYRIARTEAYVFEHHPSATHFRYPFVYGPRQLAPREWCIVRRVLDGRRHIVLPDGGLTLVTFGFTENLAHAVLLAVDNDAARGEIFNCGDEECLTLRQVTELVADELDHRWEIVDMPAQLAVSARPLLMADRSTHRVLDIAKACALLGYRDVVPAREAVRRTARWLVEHRPEPGGVEERVLQDPFDYAAEDALIAAWERAMRSFPTPTFTTEPGPGLAYGGPGTSYVRPDTRI
jgi:nucleoside-diphosphate-sugar epimerase